MPVRSHPLHRKWLARRRRDRRRLEKMREADAAAEAAAEREKSALDDLLGGP